MNPGFQKLRASEGLRLTIGTLICGLFIHLKGSDPRAATWIENLLMVSVLVLMPLARKLHGDPTRSEFLANADFFSGLLLAQSLFAPVPSWRGIILACPWLCLRVVEAGLVANAWRAAPSWSPARLCQMSARVFPAIGAAWLVANRANWTPFGFDALIVLLTSAHFHHAGFTLPLMAGLSGQALPGAFSQWACSLILAGVPLVALGITSTHFHVLPWVEPLSVTVLVAGALAVAALQMRMALQSGLTAGTRGLFFISGAALFTAMLLALGFGLRSVLPQWALPMPSMWAIHGGLNTFGFGLCGLLAWRQFAPMRPFRK